tara:strand:+ start:964 stop:1434 length:471 start_codon:yes stop_codon:yes gene_type:complete
MKTRNRIYLSTLGLGLLMFFGCNQNSNGKSSHVKYLQSEAHAQSDAPYSQAVQVGDMIYLSGVIGRKPGEPDLPPGGITVETRQALTNVKTLLETYGSSMDKVVKCMCMLGDIGDYDDMNAEYKKFFPNNRPARSTFGVALPLNAKIEIECMAKID